MTRALLLSACLLLVASCGGEGCSQIGLAIEQARQTPSLAGSLRTAKDFTTTCTTTATQIVGGDGFASLYCDNNSTTSVFLGGADVDTTGLCISTNSSNCPRRDLPADFGYGALYCRVASGTQAINCLAGK